MPEKSAARRGLDGRATLLSRARELVPLVASRVAQAEESRRLPDETIDDLRRTGLLRMLQPAHVGGSELDYGMLVDTSAILAQGCPSTAWVLANLASHHWMLAMFPSAAQEEVWGSDRDALISASFIFPAGRAHSTEGGYIVSGRWPFCAGVSHADWTMVGAIVQGDEERAAISEYRIFLLPRTDYRVVDVWRAAGLQAADANDVEAEKVFVPVDRTVAVDALKGGNTPGSIVNKGALYRIPVFATFPYVLSGTALGIAEAAVSAFLENAGTRITTYTGVVLGDFETTQIQLAEASACGDVARLVMSSACAEVQQLADQGLVPDMLTKVRWRRDAAFAVSLCVRSVELLFQASGAGVVFNDHPLQRTLRNIDAVKAHLAFNPERAGASYGRVALGHTADNPTL
jgi:3-hydroxy-9,10-secoandrosta-1,3,5(10)-triene-9,17-dione monooxygenase